MSSGRRWREEQAVFAVRIHGRGGQGVVTAAELLSIAAFLEGRHAQAFPTFGSERTGAPVTSYCRIDTETIRLREPIAIPDAVIVQDPTLLRQIDAFAGLRRDGYAVVNSTRSVDELGLTTLSARLRPERLVSLDATQLGRQHLGRPLPNAALLGALAALSGVVGIDSVQAAIRRRFDAHAAAGNAAAARAAYDVVQAELLTSDDQERNLRHA